MCKQKLIKPAACYTRPLKFDINKWIRKHNDKNIKNK